MESPKSILFQHNIYAKKRLGQNFLKTENISNVIINDGMITNKDFVLEIGSGLGALTIPLARVAKKIFAIEKDFEIAKILLLYLDNSKIKNVELMVEDILKISFINIYKKNKKKLILVGNIPYNISNKILLKIIKNRFYLSKALVMLQKEVAERICAKPNSRKYGRISVILQYYTKINILFDVGPSNFFPIPKVKSTVIEILFLEKNSFQAKDEMLFLTIVKAAFSKRRKTLKNSLLNSFLGLNNNTLNLILNKANIEPRRRAESLSVRDFVDLSDNCYDICKEIIC